MKSPELLAAYLTTLSKFTVLLPGAQSFPCMVVLGIRGNAAGRPRGIEADFLQLVALAREQSPEEAWPQGPLAVDSIRYEGERIIAAREGAEYRLKIDRSCPVTKHSLTVPVDEFEGLGDLDMLTSYLGERPHTSTPLELDAHAARMGILRERPPVPTSSRKQQARFYERPSTIKTLAWLAVGVVLVLVGAGWLGSGMQQGVVVNFYGWGIIAVGAVLIVRRSLDLVFPPSRL